CGASLARRQHGGNPVARKHDVGRETRSARSVDDVAATQYDATPPIGCRRHSIFTPDRLMTSAQRGVSAFAMAISRFGGAAMVSKAMLAYLARTAGISRM